MQRFLRFLKLERARPAADTRAPLATEHRFEPEAAPPAEAEIERLRDLRREQFASGIETDQKDPAEQPFRQCAVCEADNSRFAERCMNCGANLSTPEQRA